MAINLLPPNASRLERAFDRVAARRLATIDADPSALWDPATCPITLLPWLAWTFHVDIWDADWTDERKRAVVAGAIEFHRRRGTRWSVEQVLASFDQLLRVTAWHETVPRGDPFTFLVTQPVIGADGLAGGERLSAATARAIVNEINRVKSARDVFELVQSLDLAGVPAPFAAAQATGYRRIDLAAADGDPAVPWGDLLQDQNGEPLTDDAGGYLDGAAP